MGGSCSRNVKLQVVRYRRVPFEGILISIEFLQSDLFLSPREENSQVLMIV